MNTLARAFVGCLVLAAVFLSVPQVTSAENASKSPRATLAISAPQAVPTVLAKGLPPLDDPDAPWATTPREHVFCSLLLVMAYYYGGEGDFKMASIYLETYYMDGC